MTPSTLRTLRELASKASPGPWYSEPCFAGPSCWCRTLGTVPGSDDLEHCIVPAASIEQKDADYIAAANPATILALLDRIEALEAVWVAARVFVNNFNSSQPRRSMDDFWKLSERLDALEGKP